MVLTKIAERMGLLDMMAPRHKAKERKEQGGMKGAESRDREGGGDRRRKERKGEGGNAAAKDDDASRKVDKSEDIRRRRLRAQLDAELAAEKTGSFAKKQRVEYHHKATDRRYDAFVVGVHFDDGPDHPYYVSI